MGLWNFFQLPAWKSPVSKFHLLSKLPYASDVVSVHSTCIVVEVVHGNVALPEGVSMQVRNHSSLCVSVLRWIPARSWSNQINAVDRSSYRGQVERSQRNIISLLSSIFIASLEGKELKGKRTKGKRTE
jgi:hypothetical protein